MRCGRVTRENVERKKKIQIIYYTLIVILLIIKIGYTTYHHPIVLCTVKKKVCSVTHVHPTVIQRKYSVKPPLRKLKIDAVDPIGSELVVNIRNWNVHVASPEP